MKEQELRQIREVIKKTLEEGYNGFIDLYIERIVQEIENDEVITVDDCDNFIWFMGYKQGLQTARRIVESFRSGKESE